MGHGVGSGVDSIEQTPTWAVAGVCFVLVIISIAIDHVINLLAKFFRKHHKRALYEALEKIKSELMLLGFISLLLTVGQNLVTNICVPRSVANSWHPCKVQNSISGNTGGHDSDESLVPSQINAAGRRLLHNPISATNFRRILVGGGGYSKCAAKNKVQLISSKAIHQLHIFIFVLAVFHVLYCATTMALGKLKIRSWQAWEDESKTAEYESSHDPNRFRFARETSFGRRHLNFWSQSPILIWMVCFFRQFVRSVPKVDYLTLRHGFIMAHLAPHSTSKFNFQKYIKRSLEDDFKVVVGISPPIWFFAVLFLLFNTHGWDPYLWLPFIPLIIILLVGTKLQVVIIRMALQITEHGDVVKGIPVVHPTDELFWFKHPHLILHLIHFVLFQNAFQLAFFVWSCYEFGYPSCFHKRIEDIIIRISMGLLVHILCSYVTLPLYALVTQMGTNMKPTIFTERVATALRKWHQTARKRLKKDNHRSGGVTPLSTSRPATPTGHLSPVHLLRRLRSEIDNSPQFSPRSRNFDIDHLDLEDSPLPNRLMVIDSSSHHNTNKPQQGLAGSKIELQPMEEIKAQHGNTVSTDFTFSSSRR